MMYCGIHDFLLLQASCWEMSRFGSGMTNFFGNQQKKGGLLHGTRIILTGQEQNLLPILPAGVVWMMQQKKMAVFSTLPAVIVGVCCQNLFLPVTSRE